jgi:hypothetical protein
MTLVMVALAGLAEAQQLILGMKNRLSEARRAAILELTRTQGALQYTSPKQQAAKVKLDCAGPERR